MHVYFLRYWRKNGHDKQEINQELDKSKEGLDYMKFKSNKNRVSYLYIIQSNFSNWLM